MLDNFYLAQQSLRQIREDMPRGFYRQLPKLAAGPLAGYPRIYDVARCNSSWRTAAPGWTWNRCSVSSGCIKTSGR